MSSTNNEQGRGLRPGELESIFRRSNVLREELDRAKSEKSKTTLIGGFLSKNLNREVVIEVNGRTGTAVLRQEGGAGRSKYYRFEVRWDEPAVVPPDTQLTGAASTSGMMAVPSALPVVVSNSLCSPPVTLGGPENEPSTSGNTEDW